ncbi:MAG: glycosyltransferase family 4 protein [Fibrella sp.]|nr:glycosyltransferase family 4 protein [Armatimonadota bacterium]
MNQEVQIKNLVRDGASESLAGLRGLTSGIKDKTLHIAFVMEIGLGHTTFYKNLRSVVENHTDIQATWIEIRFDNPGLIFRLPKLRNDIVLRAGVQTYQKLRDATRKQQFDAIYFHTQLPAVLSHSFMRRIPSVVSIDSTPKQFLALGKHYGLTDNPRSFLQRRNESWYDRVFNTSAAVFCWSQWAADSVVQDYGLPASRTQVFQPGVDLSTWVPSHGTQGEEVKLLFVGGDFFRKGGDLLLRWMRECAPPWCSLDVVTRDTVPDTPRVRVHHDIQPNSDVLKALYRGADLFVFPTFADVAGLVLTEAMASGLPVLTTGIAAIPELVTSKTGSVQPAGLIPPEHWEALEQKLTHLVHDKSRLRAMGQAARAHAELQFDGTRNLLAELDALKQIASRSQIHTG